MDTGRIVGHGNTNAATAPKAAWSGEQIDVINIP
jgi:hypothetical protein